MRVKLIILSLLFSLSLQAEKHYVATGGGGLGTLASPFANLTQVNAHTFVAGDSLLFNKGNSFYGTLTMDASGSAGSPIYISSYGIGAMPIITGFSTLSSWTDNGDGKYYATVTGAEAQTNMLTIDGVNTAMGRYPDAGTNLNYESHNTTLSITDNQTLSATTDWTGADVVINKCWWILERSHITSHVNAEITYSVYKGTSYGLVNDNRYFFIQNDLRCVTGGNEWYHDYAAGRFYIWGNPSTKTVKIATINNLINVGNYDYITIDGIKLSGCTDNAINIGNSSYITGNSNNIIIKNCDVEYAGFIGISCIATQDNCTIDNNNVTQCNGDAILIGGGNISVTNNDISYCGIVPGTFYRGTDNQGIRTYGDDGDYHLIEYNNIEYVGYNGIGIYSDTYHLIRYNYINYSMQVTDDGGGIYRGSNNNYRSTISNNVILNTAIGNVNAVISRGIYTDARCSNMTITDNVVYNSQGAGIIIHSGRNTRIENNLLYGNKYGITFQYYDTINKFDTVRYNKVIARAATDYTFHSVSFTLPQIQNFGTLDSNYYARPIDDDDVIMNQSVANYTRAAWYALTGLEQHTLGSPTAIDNVNKLHFIYNATEVNTYYDLSVPMVDIANTNYSGQIILLPYTGLLLIGDGTVTEQTFEGTSYYVKNDGSDALDGLSDATAWATIAKVNGFTFTSGDRVLFKKDNVWREYISFAPPAGTALGRVTYSSYGIGNKPLFLGSKEENEDSDWADQGGNIWKNADAQFNYGDGVGNLIFNGEESIGHKELTIGSVNAQGDWFWNDAERAVYLYSVSNPGTFYTDIECALDKNVIELGSRDYVTLNGLDVRYGGLHGINGSYGNDNITISNCHISYIGGCEFPNEMARVGNGIQFWAGATNILIENNVVEEIYDDGITPQTDTNTNTYTVQIDVIGNLVRNCRLGLHTFERSVNSTIQMNWYNNTVVGMGEEWGANQRPDSTFPARSVRIAGVTGTIDYFNIKNNIFYDADYVCFYSYGSVPLAQLSIDYNLYYNTTGDIAAIESTLYSTLLSWQTALAQEAHAVNSNPLFVSSSDFNLQPGSPAIDKGVDVGIFYYGSAPDIGAFESLSTLPEPVLSGGFAKDKNNNFMIDKNGNFMKIE